MFDVFNMLTRVWQEYHIDVSRVTRGAHIEYLSFIHSFSILSDARSKASSKMIPPHSAI